MEPKSNIQRGRRFENYVAREIEVEGLGGARRETGSGSGTKKGDIFANLPFLIECKNQKKNVLKWWQSIGQAKEQAAIGNWAKEKWMLVVRDPGYGEFKQCYAMIDLHEMLRLLKKDQEPRIKAPDREMRWKLERFVAYGKALLKELETK